MENGIQETILNSHHLYVYIHVLSAAGLQMDTDDTENIYIHS